jgi:dynein light chain roadblock-type
VDEALHRLSKKPGVKGWLMLDRSTGAILKTNGQIAAIRPAKSTDTDNPLPTPTGASFSSDVATVPDNDSETKAAQELGSMIWAFLSTAGSLVQEIDTEVWEH